MSTHDMGSSGSAVSSEPRLAVVVEPTKGWQSIGLAELWKSRELILLLAWRDINVRYKQTFIGVAWAVAQPLMMMLVFSLVFGRMRDLATSGVSYPIFVLAGILPWSLFASSLSAVANSVLGNEKLITKVYFPRLAVPIASVSVPLADFIVSLLLLVLILVYNGYVPGVRWLLAVLVVACILALAIGIGAFLAALNVYYRDIKHIIPFFVQFGLFATPSIYMDSSRLAQHQFGWLLELNPMVVLVTSFRACLLGGSVPAHSLLAGVLVSAVCAIGGCVYYRRFEDYFADVI